MPARLDAPAVRLALGSVLAVVLALTLEPASVCAQVEPSDTAESASEPLDAPPPREAAPTPEPTPTPEAAPTPEPTATPSTASSSAARDDRAEARRQPEADVPDVPDEEDEEADEDSYGVVYIQPRFGYSFVNMIAFSQENFIPEAERIQGSGFHGGLGLGFRFYWLTLGAYVDLARFPDFHIGVVGPEVALHFPIPVVQPYLRVALGYAWVGNPNFDEPSLSETTVTGLAAEAGFGLDVKLSRALSLGAGADIAFLNLTRQGVAGARTIGAVDLEENGDSVGLMLRISAQLTLHI